ncbi:MAG TPA: hypothetical protein VMZ71_04765 [Gemmataceae bacterium]|nr:hypothetical protein [Gemmataceae bacterium]
MKRRSYWRAGLVALLIGGCATFLLMHHPHWSEAQLRRLQQDAAIRVPVGSSRQQVEEWFASHGIPCRPVATINSQGKLVRITGYGGQTDGSAGLEDAEIHIYFDFDEHDRVKSVSITRFIYCL